MDFFVRGQLVTMGLVSVEIFVDYKNDTTIKDESFGRLDKYK
jgi:hypothetical protein